MTYCQVFSWKCAVQVQQYPGEIAPLAHHLQALNGWNIK